MKLTCEIAELIGAIIGLLFNTISLGNSAGRVTAS